MKNYILLLIIVILTLNSCNKNHVYTDLLEVPYLEEHFSKHEIKELSKILIEFEKILFMKSESNDMLKRYSDFCIDIENKQKYPEFLNQIKSYISDKSKVYQHISKEVFNTIWKIEKGYNRESGISSKSLTIKFDGGYARFLNDYSQKSPLLKEYAESLEISGCLSPSMVAIFQKRWKELDLSDAGARLIVAIHYITLADGDIVYKD